jgi:hypothetical protein
MDHLHGPLFIVSPTRLLKCDSMMNQVFTRAGLTVLLMMGYVGAEAAQNGLEKMLNGAPGAVYTPVGRGTSSCETWTNSRSAQKSFDLEQWILGFLSGVGFDAVDGTDPLKLLGTEVVFGWIDNYCLVHPLDRITGATAAFVNRGSRPILTLQ